MQLRAPAVQEVVHVTICVAGLVRHTSLLLFVFVFVPFLLALLVFHFARQPAHVAHEVVLLVAKDAQSAGQGAVKHPGHGWQPEQEQDALAHQRPCRIDPRLSLAMVRA